MTCGGCEAEAWSGCPWCARCKVCLKADGHGFGCKRNAVSKLAATALILICLGIMPGAGPASEWHEWCWDWSTASAPFASEFSPQAACWGDPWQGATVVRDNCGDVLEPACDLVCLDARWRSRESYQWHSDHGDCCGPCKT